MRYYIWSHVHQQWWRADHSGYAELLKEAGLYSKAEATEIVFGALPGANVPVEEPLAKEHLSRAIPPNVERVLDEWRRL